MIIPFTKMQGAENDFVVIDETKTRYTLTPEHYRFIANRNFGVGADQILSVRPPPYAGVDFEYVIHNSDGGEVEHCGNGARCFVRFVQEAGLTDKNPIRVKVHTGEIELRALPDGRVRVDMGPPVFELAKVPFDPAFATLEETVSYEALNNNFKSKEITEITELTKTTDRANKTGDWSPWVLKGLNGSKGLEVQCPPLSVLSMGNPHAVCVVQNTETTPVLELGPLVEHHPAFPNRVNVGFMQILNRAEVNLRVFERGAGETLACGTGACAAVVAGVRAGLLDSCVDVHTRGGLLTIEWAGFKDSTTLEHVFMTGPAVSVFKGEIKINE